MVLSGVPWKKSPVTPPGIDLRTVRLVAQRLNHYATPGPLVTGIDFVNFILNIAFLCISKVVLNTIKNLEHGFIWC